MNSHANKEGVNIMTKFIFESAKIFMPYKMSSLKIKRNLTLPQ